MTHPERIWHGPDNDDGSVHVVGNGQIAAYGCGPNLFNIFGPPYSGPSWGSLALADSGLTCRAWREPGTAIWHYRLADAQGNEVAEFTDLAVAGHALLARHCRCRQPLNLSLRLADEKARHFATTNEATRMLFFPRGRPYYWDYPLTDAGYCLVSATGAATLAATDGNSMTLRLSDGDSMLTFAAAGTLPEATQTSEWAATAGWDGLLDRTRRHWSELLAPMHSLPAAGELDPARLTWMVDSTAVQILAQQGLTGGVLAGHNYGFLLLGMDRIRHPQAGVLARRTLDLLDPTGAWVEYYADGKPQGTRCRPWESAINCLAILRHLRRAEAGRGDGCVGV